MDLETLLKENQGLALSSGIFQIYWNGLKQQWIIAQSMNPVYAIADFHAAMRELASITGIEITAAILRGE